MWLFKKSEADRGSGNQRRPMAGDTSIDESDPLDIDIAEREAELRRVKGEVSLVPLVSTAMILALLIAGTVFEGVRPPAKFLFADLMDWFFRVMASPFYSVTLGLLLSG